MDVSDLKMMHVEAGLSVAPASARRSVDKVRGTVLQIASVTKYYGEQLALEAVGFSVQAGEILGLIGPNGAGKTTLLEAIAGLLPVDSGEIRFHDQPLPAHRRREVIFYLPDGVRP